MATPGSTQARRTQAARSTDTRRRLTDAAVASLIDRGWAATTAVEVCQRAGLTRGALVHHYPTLPALLADALQSVYDQMVAEIGERPTTLVELVDQLWAVLGQRRTKAVFEAWLAAANDPSLRAEIGPVMARFAALVSPGEVGSPLLPTAEHAAFAGLAREAMLGLALGRATAPGDRAVPHEGPVVDLLRRQAADLDAQGAS